MKLCKDCKHAIRPGISMGPVDLGRGWFCKAILESVNPVTGAEEYTECLFARQPMSGKCGVNGEFFEPK